MPKTAHIDMTVVLNDDVSLNERVLWAVKALPLIAKLIGDFDGVSTVRTALSKEELNAMRAYIEEHGTDMEKKRFATAREEGKRDDEECDCESCVAERAEQEAPVASAQSEWVKDLMDEIASKEESANAVKH